MKHTRLALVLLLPAAIACGGDDDGGGGANATPVDCAWFESMDNCMGAILEDIRACRPDEMTSGTWNMDNTACTYESGAVVEFTSAVPEDIFDSEYAYAFTLRDAAGASCAEVTEKESGITVTTASGTYSDGGDLVNVRIDCPDGRAFSIPTADAFACLGSLNGFAAGGQGGGSGLAFNLISGGDSVQVFSCNAM